MKLLPQIILTALVSAGVSVLTTWQVRMHDENKSDTLDVEQYEQQGSDFVEFSSEELNKMLADFALYPEDEDAVDEPPYFDESIAAMGREATASFIRAAVEYLQSQPQRTATQSFGLGRVALLQDFPDVAKKYLMDAASKGSGAAWGYLGDRAICANAQEQWLNYVKAIELGFTPARKWKEGLELDAIAAIERYTADYQDPQLPTGVLGISNARLMALRSADIDSIIQDYGFFAEQPEAKAYLAYGLGRAAYFHEPQKLDTARHFLEIAARKGSVAAMSFLAYEEFTTDPDTQIALLQKATDGGYTPAKRRLADAMKNKLRISESLRAFGK